MPKKILIIGLLLVIGNLSLVSLAQAQAKGIVPCGRCAQFGPGQDGRPVCLVPSEGATSAQAAPCTVCHFFQLLQNIINFLVYYISAPLATLMAIIIGILFLFSGGNPKIISDAKGKLWLLIWGIIWVLVSWLVLNTIINFFVDPKVLPWRPWYQIKCGVMAGGAGSPIAGGGASGGGGSSGGATSPPASTPSQEQTSAQIILQQGTCGTTSSCGGVNACSTLQAVASGQPPPVCSSGCTSSTPCNSNPNVHLSGDMLNAIDAMYLEGFRYKIESLTTGSHKPGSLHYQGRAVDLTPGGDTTYAQLEQRLLTSFAMFVQCENSSGAKVSCASGSVGHIHAEFR